MVARLGAVNLKLVIYPKIPHLKPLVKKTFLKECIYGQVFFQ